MKKQTDIDANGICEYCGTRIPRENHGGSALPPEELIFKKRQRVITNKLRHELIFLEEQYRETGHPSLPIKIMAVHNKLDRAIAELKME